MKKLSRLQEKYLIFQMHFPFFKYPLKHNLGENVYNHVGFHNLQYSMDYILKDILLLKKAVITHV